MPDLRAALHLIGLLVAALGATMAAPMLADVVEDDPNWRAFGLAGFISVLAGALLAASGGSDRKALSVQETFLLTTLCWLLLPVFGALPFVLGAPDATLTDAYFEAMSGMTTTGSTVFVGLDDMPRGVLLWRGMLQWFGGVGIVVMAMAFLPALRVGGMQIFRSEAFDTFGKILPRAGEIAMSISWVYAGLTLLCILAYAACGMSVFDAVVHAMTTISTGGFANYDASLGHFSGVVEYVSSLFMMLASLPFVRLVQLASGEARPIWRDPQVRGFMAVIFGFAGAVLLYRMLTDPVPHAWGFEQHLRETLFNTVSILTGTGYASENYNEWGPFAAAAFFLMGLVGGCAGSTCCSVKIFRYQILLAAIASQVRRIHSPHGVFQTRWAGRPVDEEVISSVMSFLFLFFMTLAVLAVALGMLGHDIVTSVSGAATALANVGPGLGPIIGPAGNFAPLSDAAKWILALGMLLGRLELMAVYVMLTAAFWRN
ncbi:TrkH family potassium uptake protein [Albimonas sp. CAU 1670]|uniref:TrkH family potassium uptake protein n=1 Tax=Albimonas sp. CAU 1670 TaxID=3032599 RepID=UPI0023D9E53D|nr:TrkH family potassium uptake protein [Albimonas sp. CAU 1670]MDF2234293.1 TrkH family potassium uptake protein [Albimonas sp. CAU 1670]